MDIGKILLDLRTERERINAAIAAIEALTAPNTSRHSDTVAHPQSGSANHSGRSRMSLAGRKRMSEMMKRRWAERKTKAKKS